MTTPTGKRDAILAAARRAFLEGGYESASMDAIAAEAGASKRTVYNHFPTKQALFTAMVDGLYAELQAERVPSADLPLERALGRFSARLLEHQARPEILALLRLVIAERPRFPELAEDYLARGKRPAIAALTELLAAQQTQGRMHAVDPALAAMQFLGMLKEALFWPRLLGAEPAFPPEQVCSAAIAAFCAAYAVKA